MDPKIYIFPSILENDLVILARINGPELYSKDPARLVEKSVKGMLPKNKLGSTLFRNLSVFVGASHSHEAQKPQTINLNDIN